MYDPKRFYATLRVKPSASAKEVAAAYRRLAKVLHPDVPVTGSAAAFMRVHEAYAVLQDPLERARYDRMAREGGGADGTIWNEAGWAAGRGETPGAWAYAHAGEADADLADLAPQPQPPRPRVRWFRPSTLARAAAVLLTLGAIGFGASELLRPRPAASPAAAAPLRSSAIDAVAPPTEDPGPPAADAKGEPSYVLPADGRATFWRFDRAEGHYRPAGRLEPFTELQVLRLVPRSGMAEVRLADQRLGYVEAHLIAAGDGETARRADCVYNAGAPPQNGELLTDARGAEASGGAAQPAGGRAVTVDNNAELPAVFALRSGGAVAAVVYVQAHRSAMIDGVPPGRYRAEYAIGDLWSRACFRFAAGMRTQRLASEAPLAGRYAIPDPTAADVPGLAVGQAGP